MNEPLNFSVSGTISGIAVVMLVVLITILGAYVHQHRRKKITGMQ